MHSDIFDRYHHSQSLLHRLDPRIKVAIAIAFIFSNALLPDGAWAAFGLSFLFLLLAVILSNLGLTFTIRRSLIALPFALAAVTVLFLPQGTPVTKFHFLFWSLTITDVGFIRFISIVIRSWLSVQMAVLLVAVTQFPDLVHALEHLRVPRLITTIIAFLYRYLFILTDEVLRLSRARRSRSAGFNGKKVGRDVIWRAQVAGHMTGQLFLRSYERSDRIYHAMLSRGYTGNLRTLNPHQYHGRDWIVAAVALIFVLLIQIIGYL